MELNLWVIHNITSNALQSKMYHNRDDTNRPRIFYSKGTAQAFITSHKNNMFVTDYWKDNEFKPLMLWCKEHK